MQAGHLCSYRGLDLEASAYFQQSISIARRGGFVDIMVHPLSRLGCVHLTLGERALARQCLEEAIAAARRTTGARGAFETAANSLAELERLEGNIDAARSLYEESLRKMRANGDRLTTMIALNNLSMVAVMKNEPMRARNMLLESLSISDDLGSRCGRLVVMEVCAGLAASLEHFEPTPRFDAAADIHTVQMGRRRDVPDAAFLAPLVERAKTTLGPNDYAAAVEAGRALSYDNAVAEMTAWLTSLKPAPLS